MVRQWTRADRWYCAEVTQDLFDRVLVQTWGGRGRAAIGRKISPIASDDEAADALSLIDARRRAHGYAALPVFPLAGADAHD